MQIAPIRSKNNLTLDYLKAKLVMVVTLSFQLFLDTPVSQKFLTLGRQKLII